MFGGLLGDVVTGGSAYGDTWEWDPGTGAWADVTPPAGSPQPSPRHSMGLVYDVARARTFLWGGFDELGREPVDAWEWDGASRSWSDRTPATLPASWPAGRDGHNLVYDPVRRRTLLYGGYDGDYFGDLWAWDGGSGTWTSLTPTPPPSAWPPRRHSASAGFDPALDRLVVFGGFDGDTRGDLWEWLPAAGGTWRDRTPAVAGERAPGPRYGGLMVWDRLRGRLLLFGGYGPSVAANEVWEWDGS
jgi:hypothetical protein